MKSKRTVRTQRYVIEGCIQPGASAIFRIIASAQLGVAVRDECTFAIQAADATIIRGAIYSDAVLANGWEPFNQPSPAAYLPLSFRSTTRRRLRGFGELLLETTPSHGDVTTFATDARNRFVRTASTPKEVWQVLVDVCERTGVSSRVAENAVRSDDLLAA